MDSMLILLESSIQLNEQITYDDLFFTASLFSLRKRCSVRSRELRRF